MNLHPKYIMYEVQVEGNGRNGTHFGSQIGIENVSTLYLRFPNRHFSEIMPASIFSITRYTIHMVLLLLIMMD